MPISFQCPNGHALRVKDEFAGKKSKCPKCGAITDVPELPPLETATAPGAADDDPGYEVVQDDAGAEPQIFSVAEHRPAEHVSDGARLTASIEAGPRSDPEPVSRRRKEAAGPRSWFGAHYKPLVIGMAALISFGMVVSGFLLIRGRSMPVEPARPVSLASSAASAPSDRVDEVVSTQKMPEGEIPAAPSANSGIERDQEAKARPVEPKVASDDLRGEWRLVSYQERGSKNRAKGEIIVKITEDTIDMRPFSWRAIDLPYKLDSTQKPKEIDLWEGAGKFSGIYWLNGDTLQICHNMRDTARATKFESNQFPDSENWALMTFRRVSPSRDGSK